MKILLTADPEIAIPPAGYGGIERIVDGLIQEFRRLGHVVALAGNPLSTVGVDQFFPWPGSKSGSKWDTLKNMVVLFRAVKSFRPDVVQSFSRLAYMLPFLGAKIPKVMSYQREPTPNPVRLAARLGGKNLRFTGCSQFIADLGKKSGGNWIPIPNFVNTDKFDFVSEVPEDAPLVFLSRIEEIKGAHLAIEIAKQSGKKLILAGNHSADAKSQDYWKNRIYPNIDGQQIRYVGTVNDSQKNALLGKASAMLVPIQWDEPFGIVFAEALACGTPIISSPRGSLPEIMAQGRKFGSIGGLGSTITEWTDLIGTIPRFSREACRTYCLEHYSLRKIAIKYLDFYKEAFGLS